MKVTTCAILACLVASGAAAQSAGQPIASEGDWILRKSDDASTCIVTPKAQSRIQVTQDRLEVTGLPKKSIFNYQFRINDQSVSNFMIPTADMQDAGLVALDGEAFKAILDGQRFRIRILDKWHEAITEDVGLAGLRSLHRKIASDCR
ncbi:hypothetical protein ACFQE0_23535 [Methylobacterium komagatae]|uniref:Invasion associated locus B family protein n=1 Tax=Methylobacterium komagatae TaxID=374425 RepID=A0ABW2BP85_9HYPH